MTFNPLLNIDGLGGSRRGNCPFRFIAAWVLHEKFEKFVKDNWLEVES